jgi:hypothetical protein
MPQKRNKKRGSQGLNQNRATTKHAEYTKEEAQTSLPLVIVRPEWICAKMLVGQEDSGFGKSAAAGLRPENGSGTFLP